MTTVSHVAAWLFLRQTHCSNRLGQLAVKVNARHGQRVQDDRKVVHLDVHALAAVAAVVQHQTEVLAVAAAAVEAEVPEVLARGIQFVLDRALGILGHAVEGNIFFFQTF